MTAASSQKARNWALALLTLWFVVSLIVIVVWSTSPDLKSSAQCREELRGVRDKLRDTEESRRLDKKALEELVERERDEKSRLAEDKLLLVGQLNTTNSSLLESREETRVLMGNISALMEEVEQLRQTETNLTAQLMLQKDHIEILELNLTQVQHQTESCISLKAAAHSQMLAAQSQTKACESKQLFTGKQLQKCELRNSEASQQTGTTGSASPLGSVAMLTLLICSSLHLIT